MIRGKHNLSNVNELTVTVLFTKRRAIVPFHNFD